MLDFDLAELYEPDTQRWKESVLAFHKKRPKIVRMKKHIGE